MSYEVLEITMNNGFFGCEEIVLMETADDEDLTYTCGDFLQNEYSFAEPDSRFIGRKEDYDSEEEYLEAYNSYIEELSVDAEELTYEEYLEEL